MIGVGNALFKNIFQVLILVVQALSMQKNLSMVWK